MERGCAKGKLACRDDSFAHQGRTPRHFDTPRLQLSQTSRIDNMRIIYARSLGKRPDN